jgi:pilus assembly protein Flp/PilA
MFEHLKIWAQLKSDRRAVTAMEYGIIAALLSVVIIAGATAAGPELKGIFDSLGTSLKAANTPAAAS